MSWIKDIHREATPSKKIQIYAKCMNTNIFNDYLKKPVFLGGTNDLHLFPKNFLVFQNKPLCMCVLCSSFLMTQHKRYAGQFLIKLFYHNLRCNKLTNCNPVFQTKAFFRKITWKLNLKKAVRISAAPTPYKKMPIS